MNRFLLFLAIQIFLFIPISIISESTSEIASIYPRNRLLLTLNDEKKKDILDSQAEESDSQTEESDSQTEESDSQTEENDSQTEESDSQTEENGSQAEESGSQAEESGSQAEESGSQAEESGSQAEESDSQAEESDSQAEESDSQDEESDSQDEESDSQAEESDSQDEEPTVPEEPEIREGEIAPQKTKNKILLNFENIDLLNFVKEIADLTNINLIHSPDLEGNKISLNMRHPVSIKRAWAILQTMLRLSNFVMVKIGDAYKITARGGATNEPLTYIGIDPDLLPDSDEIIRYIAILENLQVTDESIASLLDSMLGDPKTVIASAETNSFIIADSGYNIKAALKVLRELDKAGQPEMVEVIRLKDAYAREVKTLLEALIGKSNSNQHPLAHLLRKKPESTFSYFSKNTRIIADERTNSLILLGPRKSILKIETFIKEHIDKEIGGQKKYDSPLHVYELQYTDAAQMEELLRAAIAPPESDSGQKASRYGYVLGGVKYFRDSMKIKADTDRNRIIVSSIDKNDWKLLKQTIKNLDIPQPQVAIETLIVAVRMDEGKELGGQIRNRKHGMIGRNVDFQSTPILNTIFERNSSDEPISLLGSLLQGLTSTAGQTLLTFGCDANIWAIFRALRTITNATIVAKPFLSIANKFKANIVIGEQKRVVQATTSDQTGFEWAEANLDLTIQPRINIDGVINLNVNLDFDQFENPEGTLKTKRNLSTDVSIADGQVLVLGGFVRNKITEVNSSVPLLGNIPIFGWFFKNKVTIKEKITLLVFLHPTIIKPRSKQGVNPYTKMKLDEARMWVDETITSHKTPDPVANWFFSPDKSRYGYKIEDFANARYQPTTVDIKNDPYYRSRTKRKEKELLLSKKSPKNINRKNRSKVST